MGIIQISVSKSAHKNMVSASKGTTQVSITCCKNLRVSVNYTCIVSEHGKWKCFSNPSKAVICLSSWENNKGNLSFPEIILPGNKIISSKESRFS